MADTAAWLVDRVLPDVGVRQWVLTFPWSVRFQLARDPALCRAVRRTFLRAVFADCRRRSGLESARTGAVNVVQRFASALNLNVHFHALVLDGVTTCESPWADPVFHPLAPPTDEDVANLCRTIRNRVLRLLERRGLLESDAGNDADLELSLLDALTAASIAGRVALGERAGRPLARIGAHPGREVGFVPGELCAQIDGFSLHARVRVPSGDRTRLERLCRYVARPAIATERLSLSKNGNLLYRFRRPWRDGSTHVVFEPLVFLERLAALVPRPRTHLVTYHGVLAPAATLRDRIVPGPRPQRRSAGGCNASADRRHPWAELLKRVFAVDVLRCADCGGRRVMIATITTPEPIQRILTHLGLAAKPPPIAPARPHPETFAPF
jgi:hypothetical protein